jgi:rhodanese-related sulfurtransferase
MLIIVYANVNIDPGAEKLNLKILFDPVTGVLLGGQCVGKQGVDKRIDVLSMAIQSRQTVYDLEEVELCYAPPFGAGKDPLNHAGMIASNILRGIEPIEHWSSRSSAAWAAIKSEGIQLVDVRNPGEHKAGHVPNSILIPISEMRNRMNELDKSKPVLCYCAVGKRGYLATRILMQNGFNAKNISGGYSLYSFVFPTSNL